MFAPKRPPRYTPQPVPRFRDSHGQLPELFRQLYTSLELSAINSQIVIGVTSAIRGEGRTSMAIGLAMTLRTDLDVPITLVDVDLEHPCLARYFGMAPGPGLSEVLQGKYGLDMVMQALHKNLSVVVAGSGDPDPKRLLRRLPTQDPFHYAQDAVGVTILDLPPIMAHSYSSLAAGVADATVLVVRAGVTPAPMVREAIKRLEQRPPHGIVLNGFRAPLPGWWPKTEV